MNRWALGVAERADDLRWALLERYDALETRWQRAAKTLLAGALLLGAAGLLVLALGERVEQGDEQLVRAELEEVARNVEADLAGAVAALPDGTVRTVTGSGESLEGTIAKRTSTGECLGFEVSVGAGYVLTGAQDEVEAGEVGPLPAEACTPRAER